MNSLVYSGTHIVRLRVSRGSTLLADVGGPYILAPVGGMLRSHGHAIGHYELSVQDDLGYVKLETRFIGAPLVLRIGSRERAGRRAAHARPGVRFPSTGPSTTGASPTRRSPSARVPSRAARCASRCSLPLPGGIAGESCAEVRSAELGLVAQRISQQFPLSPGDFSTYVKLDPDRSPERWSISAPARASWPAARRADRRELPSLGLGQVRVRQLSGVLLRGSLVRGAGSRVRARAVVGRRRSHRSAPMGRGGRVATLDHQRAAPCTAARPRRRPAWAGPQ